MPTHAVKAVITNGESILFLQRDGRARADGKSNWDLPGGLVEDGEEDVVALEREVEEELGRKGKVERKLGKWTFFRPFDGQIVEVTNYSVTLDVGSLDELALSDEHTAARFVNRADLSNLDVKDPSILQALGE